MQSQSWFSHDDADIRQHVDLSFNCVCVYIFCVKSFTASKKRLKTNFTTLYLFLIVLLEPAKSASVNTVATKTAIQDNSREQCRLFKSRMTLKFCCCCIRVPAGEGSTPIALERPATLASDTPRPLYGQKLPKN